MDTDKNDFDANLRELKRILPDDRKTWDGLQSGFRRRRGFLCDSQRSPRLCVYPDRVREKAAEQLAIVAHSASYGLGYPNG